MQHETAPNSVAAPALADVIASLRGFQLPANLADGARLLAHARCAAAVLEATSLWINRTADAGVQAEDEALDTPEGLAIKAIAQARLALVDELDRVQQSALRGSAPRATLGEV